MAVKLQLTISDEAWAIVEQAATERKRGDWLSAAIVDYDRIVNAATTDIPAGDGILEQISERMARLEKQIANLTLIVQQGK